MLTWQHGFWLYFFSRRSDKVWQFVLGSMAPDYVYIALIMVLLAKQQLTMASLLNVSPTTFMTYIPLYPWAVYGDLLGHSVVIWSGALILGVIRFRGAMPFIIGWGTHLVIDTLTHGAHANYLFYPISMNAIHAPISYWEPEYFSREFKIVNGALMALTAVYLIIQLIRRRAD